MGFPSSPANKDLRERPDFERDEDSGDNEEDDGRQLNHSQKKKKSVRIVEEKENHYE